MELKKGDLLLGERISVDHYRCAQRGCTYSSRGSSRTNATYCGGLLASDHASGYISIRHQESTPTDGSVHMAARYTHSPKQSHENAVIRFCRYLKHTRSDGLILRPNNKLELTLWTDADFAGHFGTTTEDPTDSITAKSRAGYIITFAGCPIVWVSKLMSEVRLSTLEAEFIAYSTGMRCLLPLKQVLSHFVKSFNNPIKDVRHILKSTAFIDNSGALQLAQNKRITPRTRYIAAKYSWFLDKFLTKDVIPEKIDGKLNISDITLTEIKLFAYENDSVDGNSSASEGVQRHK